MLYVIAKIAKTVIEPLNLFSIVLLCCGIACIFPKQKIRDFGRKFCFVLSVVLFSIGIIPVGHWLLYPLENFFPAEIPTKVDGIILLGGDEDPFLTEKRGQAALGSAARRHMAFSALARKYPEAILVFSGGNSGINQRGTLTNEDVARKSMEELGINPDKVIYETKSRNTYENAKESFTMIKPTSGQNWLLVTSAVHMPRALLTFRKVGWNVFPAPTDYHTAPGDLHLFHFHLLWRIKELTLALYEYTALVSYKVTGRI